MSDVELRNEGQVTPEQDAARDKREVDIRKAEVAEQETLSPIWRDQIEPVAVALYDLDGLVGNAMSLSIAISLKRLADQGVAPALRAQGAPNRDHQEPKDVTGEGASFGQFRSEISERTSDARDKGKDRLDKARARVKERIKTGIASRADDLRGRAKAKAAAIKTRRK